jgi:hypothetical protein
MTRWRWRSGPVVKRSLKVNCEASRAVSLIAVCSSRIEGSSLVYVSHK